MTNRKQTSNRTAKLASDTLRDPGSSAIQKRLAGSVLAQASTGKQTGKAMEAEAARVLNSDKYSDTTKALAGSVLSQSDKDR